MNTAGFNLCCLRIFILIDHVLVDAIGHKFVDFIFYPCGAESGEVLPCIAVQIELVADKVVGFFRAHSGFWNVLFGKSFNCAGRGVNVWTFAGTCLPQWHEVAPKMIG